MAILKYIAKSSARGGLYLFIGSTLSAGVNALTSILIGRLLGPDNYGLYSLSLTPASFLMIATNFGVTIALVKYLAEYNRRGDYIGIRRSIEAASLFQLSLGIILGLTLFFTSDFFSRYLINRPEASFYVRITSLMLIGNVVFMTFNAVFIGLDKMDKSSIMSVSQSTTKFLVAISLIILGFGVTGAVTGHVVSYLTASAVGSIAVIIYMNRHRYNASDDDLHRISVLKKMVKYGFPVYLGGILINLLGTYRNYLLSLYTLNIDIGNFMAASNLSVAISLFAGPISTVLFPSFSKLDIEKEIDTVRELFKYAVKYSTLIILPIALFLMFFSRDSIYLFYGSRFTDAPLYLTLACIPILLVGLGSSVLGSFFNGIGETRFVFKTNLLNFLLSTPLFLILIHYYSITGLLTAIIIVTIAVVLYSIYYAYRKYRVEIEGVSTAKIYVAGISAGIISFLIRSYIDFGRSIYNVVLYGVLFLTLYLLLLPLLRAISYTDLNNLKLAFEDIKIISNLINFILRVEDKLMKLLHI